MSYLAYRGDISLCGVRPGTRNALQPPKIGFWRDLLRVASNWSWRKQHPQMVHCIANRGLRVTEGIEWRLLTQAAGSIHYWKPQW